MFNLRHLPSLRSVSGLLPVASARDKRPVSDWSLSGTKPEQPAYLSVQQSNPSTNLIRLDPWNTDPVVLPQTSPGLASRRHLLCSLTCLTSSSCNP